MKRSARGWSMCLLAMIALAGCQGRNHDGGDQDDQGLDRTVEVRIGDSDSDSEKALNHDVTAASLEAGNSEFSVDGPGGTHHFRLTRSQVSDLLNGSTVMTTTSGADEEMTVTLRMEAPVVPAVGGAEEESEDSGW